MQGADPGDAGDVWLPVSVVPIPAILGEDSDIVLFILTISVLLGV